MLGPRYAEALHFAATAFEGRTRKGTSIPYISHLLQVSTWVIEHGGDEDQAIAAVLHDWLEDIEGARREDLEARFGPRVTRIVVALSDSESLPKPPWRARKESYLMHLRATDPEVRLVSAADKLHNARSINSDLRQIGDALWGRFTGGREGTLWYYGAVSEALGEGWSHPLLHLLREEVRRMGDLAGEPR